MPDATKEPEAVVISGLGLMTSVGHQVPQAVTSLRAGIMRLGELPAYEAVVRDPAVLFPEPAIAGPVAGVTDRLVGVERLLALGVPALREALADAGLQEADVPQTALFVAGSQCPDRAAGSRLATVFAPRLAQRVARASFRQVRYLPNGTAGVLLALGQAMDALRRKACAQCVVGGVDSWLDLETLAWLDQARRLKSESSPDAFVPGEAAAFLVLEVKANALWRKKEAYAECGEVAVAEEKNTIWADTPCTADALSGCLRTVLASLAPKQTRPDVVLCDLNGESYRATEWGYATTKAFRGGQPVPPVAHPADCLGDVGAATGGVLAALAAFAMKKNLAPWKAALLWCSSDQGERAAVTLLKV
jgi:3-oxoacyl-[acyl-carrier-protein] synthase-1